MFNGMFWAFPDFFLLFDVGIPTALRTHQTKPPQGIMGRWQEG